MNEKDNVEYQIKSSATVLNHSNSSNTVTLIPEDAVVEDDVIKKIIGTTTLQVDGVLMLTGGPIAKAFSSREQTRGITFHRDGEQADVEIRVTALFGKSIPELVGNVQRDVHKALLEMAGINARDIVVNVTDVLTQAEYDEKHGKKRG